DRVASVLVRVMGFVRWGGGAVALVGYDRDRRQRRANEPDLPGEVPIVQAHDSLAGVLQARPLEEIRDPHAPAGPEVTGGRPRGENRNAAVLEVRDLVLEDLLEIGPTHARSAKAVEQAVVVRRIPEEARMTRLHPHAPVDPRRAEHDADLVLG